VRRRDLLSLIGGAAAATSPLAARAQRKPMPVIGFLSLTSPDGAAPSFAAMWQGLNEAGYAEGQNAAGEYRFANSTTGCPRWPPTWLSVKSI